jgi:hypothetical protein
MRHEKPALLHGARAGRAIPAQNGEDRLRRRSDAHSLRDRGAACMPAATKRRRSLSRCGMWFLWNWRRARRNTARRILEGRFGRGKNGCSRSRATSRRFTATCITTTFWTSDARGWLAIDPKRLARRAYGFDFANIFCNPDFEVAASAGRLARQARVVAEVAHVDHRRLLQWILAYAGLSAVWIMNSGEEERLDIDLAVVELAAQALE